MDLSARTLASLDWPVVVDALAACARTPMGARAVRGLAPFEDPSDVRAAYDAVDELHQLEDLDGRPVPVGAVGDVTAPVARAAKGDVLEDPELQAVGGALTALHELAEMLLACGEEAPTLAGLAAMISVDLELEAELEGAYESAGLLSAKKWPQLGELRARIAELHDSVRRTLDELLRREDLGDVLQEHYVTLRGDRYVLPIKAHAKRWDLGIVHGTSGSGQTVYVEPHRVVELNNRLRVAEGELLAEEHRIRATLSRWIGRNGETLFLSLEAVAGIDLAAARHGLARRLEASRPVVRREGICRLQRARHPVLLLRGVPVVGNDLDLGGERPALVLTGPNTGGKTVALKTIGLCALLVRAGCFVPADAGSRCDLFDDVLADIGDAQTVHGDLSSFSAHVTALCGFLDRARPGNLLLLDELCTGTDPAQGAALARAFLEAAVASGPSVVVTTHFAQLKGLAAADPRFAVAAVEYAEGRPTYRVIPGATGESHAFAIATRIGLGARVVERARALLSTSERDLHEALSGLDRQRRDAEEIARAATERLAELAAREAEIEKKERQIRARARELEEREALRFMERLARAEKVLGEVVADLQRNPDHRRVNAARATLAGLKELLPTPQVASVEAPTLAVGARVRLRALGHVGDVVGVSAGAVQVRTGSVTLRAKPEDLELLASEEPPRPRSVTHEAPARVPEIGNALRLSDNTVDLRGMRVDDGLDEVERFLDQAVRDGRDYIFVLHGHGTGAMKTAVRRALHASPQVAKVAPANADQGGDAYTIAALRY